MINRSLALRLVTWTGLSLAVSLSCLVWMDWTWLADYWPAILSGLVQTLWLLIASILIGFVLAVALGLAQVTGPLPIALAARGFCTLIRGTPLLLQLWLLYYGLGSLFPYIPGIRQSIFWPYLTESWPYALIALSISFAGYEGETMRGALRGVPRGELEAAHALGMHPARILSRIWLPRAIQRALPTLNGEVILQLKATPLIATIAVVDIYAVIARVRTETFIIYEPLLLLTASYLIIAGIITLLFRTAERRWGSGA